MIFMRETTDWGNHNAPNHIYVLDDKKENLLAYIRQGTNEHKIFSSPIRFDTRGRKFTVIKRTEPKANLRKITGSRGEIYHVDTADHTCTCPGFKFRGNCKHVAELQQAA